MVGVLEREALHHHLQQAPPLLVVLRLREEKLEAASLGEDQLQAEEAEILRFQNELALLSLEKMAALEEEDHVGLFVSFASEACFKLSLQ